MTAGNLDVIRTDNSTAGGNDCECCVLLLYITFMICLTTLSEVQTRTAVRLTFNKLEYGKKRSTLNLAFSSGIFYNKWRKIWRTQVRTASLWAELETIDLQIGIEMVTSRHQFSIERPEGFKEQVKVVRDLIFSSDSEIIIALLDFNLFSFRIPTANLFHIWVAFTKENYFHSLIKTPFLNALFNWF